MTTNWATAQTNNGLLKRSIATYALSQPVTGAGWRTYPYSTDMSINPLTYADLPATNGLVHNIGQVWATVLWDMTWSIIQVDGINPDLYNANGPGGNSVAMKLVMTGLKLQPCSPGFIDGRDAILKADTLLYNGKYSCAIWKAFAKRGMGLYAKQGRTDNYTDQVADFLTYSFPTMVKQVDKMEAVQGETITYTIDVLAPRCEAINNFTMVDTLPKNVTFITSNGTYNAADRTVTKSGIALNAGKTKTFSISVKVNESSYSPAVKYISDSVKIAGLAPEWKNISTTNTSWKSSSAKSHSAPNAYFANDSSGITNEILQTEGLYNLEGKSVLSFWHYYDVEAGYDGGVIDISTDSGKTWIDLGPYITTNDYNGNLIKHTPIIGGRRAFIGNSDNKFLFTMVDLTAFTHKTIAFRFVFVSDESGGGDGWYIDDINLKSEAAVFNTVQLFNRSIQVKAIADTITIIKNPIVVTLCPNENTFVTSNIQGISYQWQVNAGSGFTNISNSSNYSGTNTANPRLSNIQSAWYGYQYRCIVDGNTSNVFSNYFMNQWTGAINSAWENAANWSCGSVPDGNTVVVIKSGSVIINSNALCRSLRADAGVRVVVNPTYRLTVMR